MLPKYATYTTQQTVNICSTLNIQMFPPVIGYSHAHALLLALISRLGIQPV